MTPATAPAFPVHWKFPGRWEFLISRDEALRQDWGWAIDDDDTALPRDPLDAPADEDEPSPDD